MTSSVSDELNSGGAVRSELSRTSVTSASSRAGRDCEPEKMRSSISPPRMARAELAPIAQRSASRRLDLPHPFGPTMPVRPGWIGTSWGSTKDLKPAMRSSEMCNAGSPISSKAYCCGAASPSVSSMDSASLFIDSPDMSPSSVMTGSSAVAGASSPSSSFRISCMAGHWRQA